MNKRQFLTQASATSLAGTGLLATSRVAAQPSVRQIKVLIAYHSATGNTEKMAQGVTEGAKSVAGTNAILKRVKEIEPEDLLSSDAVVVGSPVYFGTMSGEVKTFFDDWLLKFQVFPGKMLNKVGAAFVTGTAISNGKETTMQAIHAAMLINQMTIVSAGGAFGAFGASATTGPDSPGIDEKELESARALGKRVAEFTAIIQRGSKN